ncbi:hypothetical protein [Tumebacillus flagellatus]|uniref:Uncharacterized protein n=1 Tax=Tumebacillus flagellatus TaxID=1157490 RepID=A0A074LVG3_9BACL|nr:hypothetical protein [Tumebacillus flagellatus]KEO83998.1 hypothetical protein EL26_07380 [Tumebacillus flagellatus]
MPRAENRKKPISNGGGVKQGGFQNKQGNGGAGGAFGQAQSKKQALLEKMKKQLTDKSSNS